MRIIERNLDVWIYCTNFAVGEHNVSNYKLHVALPMDQYDQHAMLVYARLKKAVDEDIIRGFKMLNIGDGATLAAELSKQQEYSKKPAANITFTDVSNARVYNNPFTIYLTKEFDAEKVAALCRDLDNILKDVPAANRKHLNEADLTLASLSHITMRQEKMDGDYVKMSRHADPAQINRLREKGKQSPEYQRLRQAFMSHQESSKGKEPVANDDKDEQHEVMVDVRASMAQGLVQSLEEKFASDILKNYDFFLHALSSGSTMQKARLACQLLQISEEDLERLQDHNELRSLVASAYRKQIKKYRHLHPDVNQGLSGQPDLIVLLNLAKNAFNDIDPIRFKLAELLKQAVYEPSHDYELYFYEKDPQYYVRMAQSTSWQTLQVPLDDKQSAKETDDLQGKDFDRSSSKVPNNIRAQKTIIIQSHKAFYKLFCAGALPSNFGAHEFALIFNSLDLQHNQQQRWLAKKILIEHQCYRHIYLHDLIKIVKAAKRAGIVELNGCGDTNVAIIEYFLTHFPSHFSKRQIASGIANLNSKEKAALGKFILAHPQLWQQVQPEVLDVFVEWLPEIKPLILHDPVLCSKLNADFYKKEIVDRFLSVQNDFNGFDELLLRQILLGNLDCLQCLSDEKIQQLHNYIKTQHKHLPSWILSPELAARQAREILVEQYQNLYVDSKDYVLQELLKGRPETLQFLNNMTLREFAQLPFIPLFHRFEIIKVLQQRGESIEELLQQFQDVSTSEKPVTFDMLQEHFEKVDYESSSVRKEKDKTIEELLLRFEEAINNPNKTIAEISAIEKTLALFEAYNKELEDEAGFARNLFHEDNSAEDDRVNRWKDGHDKAWRVEERNIPTLSDRCYGIRKAYIAALQEQLKALLIRAKDKKILQDQEGQEKLKQDFQQLRAEIRRGYTKSFNLFLDDLFWTDRDFYHQFSAISANEHELTTEQLQMDFLLQQCLFDTDLKTFYQDLTSGLFVKPSEELLNSQYLDIEAIRNFYFLALADAFNARLYGFRTNIPYKQLELIFRMGRLKDCVHLAKLLGKSDEFEQLVGIGYDKIAAGEVHFDEESNLEKYISIRKHIKAVRHPNLESLAIQYQLQKIVDENVPELNKAKKTRFAFSAEAAAGNRAVVLRDQLNRVNAVYQTQETAVNNTTQTMNDLIALVQQHPEDNISRRLIGYIVRDDFLHDYISPDVLQQCTTDFKYCIPSVAETIMIANSLAQNFNTSFRALIAGETFAYSHESNTPQALTHESHRKPAGTSETVFAVSSSSSSSSSSSVLNAEERLDLGLKTIDRDNALAAVSPVIPPSMSTTGNNDEADNSESDSEHAALLKSLSQSQLQDRKQVEAPAKEKPKFSIFKKCLIGLAVGVCVATMIIGIGFILSGVGIGIGILTALSPTLMLSIGSGLIGGAVLSGVIGGAYMLKRYSAPANPDFLTKDQSKGVFGSWQILNASSPSSTPSLQPAFQSPLQPPAGSSPVVGESKTPPASHISSPD